MGSPHAVQPKNPNSNPVDVWEKENPMLWPSLGQALKFALSIILSLGVLAGAGFLIHSGIVGAIPQDLFVGGIFAGVIGSVGGIYSLAHLIAHTRNVIRSITE